MKKKLIRILRLGFLCFLVNLSLDAWGSCTHPPSDPLNRKVYLRNTPFIVKGFVKNLSPKVPKPREEVTFQIVVVDVMKGKIKEKILKVKYAWRPPFEGDRSYREGETYIFGIKNIDDQLADLDTSNCTPALKEQEVKDFLKNLN
jgi:hypothetical protein